MAHKIRVLDAANRTMQRLGFLKPLCALVNEQETSNLTSLGKRLIDRVTKRVFLTTPLDADTRSYVENRLTDRIFRELRKAVLSGPEGARISLEIQDLYLADASLPSRTGRLVQENWRRYPYLGTSLDLVRKGTYSALTRSVVLLAVTPNEELSAFNEFASQHNPLRISEAQAAVLLYCLVDNDAEVLLPLFRGLLARPEPAFDERIAGDLLPDILRQIGRNHRTRALSAEERRRLALLNKAAANIEKWKGKAYTGGGARQEAVTVRLEPFCDLGLLKKPNIDRYDYQTTEGLAVLVDRWGEVAKTDELLRHRFFETLAASRGRPLEEASDDEAIQALVEAGNRLKSSLGYSPITDVGLLAGTRLMTERSRRLELARSVELLKALQKQHPGFVRFTVDRMGALAYVKFLTPSPGART